jgi:hypothetical protein
MFAMPAKLPLLNVRRDGEAVGPDDEEEEEAAGEAVPAAAAGEAADGEEEETEAAAALVEAANVALPGNGDQPARSLPAATTWLKAGAAAAE